MSDPFLARFWDIIEIMENYVENHESLFGNIKSCRMDGWIGWIGIKLNFARFQIRYLRFRLGRERCLKRRVNNL